MAWLQPCLNDCMDLFGSNSGVLYSDSEIMGLNTRAYKK